MDNMLLLTNDEHRYHIDRWRFYRDSYTGGKDYKHGDYLHHYRMEGAEEYNQRIENVGLDNHCKNVVHIYNSFLFSTPPYRDYGSMSNDPALAQFLEDSDLEGRKFDAFMRDASVQASIYGHVWIFVDRPTTTATTRAEELQQGIRSYVSMITPENVLDWSYTRLNNGAYMLDYMKVLEYSTAEIVVYRKHYTDRIEIVQFHKEDDIETITETLPNNMGMIPAVCLYASRSSVRGIGISEIQDISDLQRMIYNEYSEIEQLIRLANNPSLVKTRNTDASAGAGAIITIDENMDPGLRPYLLQPNSGSLDGIMNSINNKIHAIDRIAHLGGVRSSATSSMSGIALQVERQLLNAKLTARADEIETAEEQIWRLWATQQGYVFDGEIDYPRSYNLRDKLTELQAIKAAVDMQFGMPQLNEQLAKLTAELLINDHNIVDDLFDDQEPEFIPHMMYGPNGEEVEAITEQDHLELSEQGYTHTPPNTENTND